MRLIHPIRNIERSVGTRLSGQLALRYGDSGLPDGHVSITFTGTGGQSFGAFGIRGLRLTIVGDANDYVGKGLGGAEIVIHPDEEARFVPHQNTIIGNTALYGVTSGRLFAAGVAGARFAVRNSGATAVVEGAGEHACEYMTAGTVVVLGETGRNFGAGMTGGEAFVYDVDEKFQQRFNTELIDIRRLGGLEYEERLRELIAEHQRKTGSQRAALILDDWEAQRQFFWHVAPRENVVAVEGLEA